MPDLSEFTRKWRHGRHIWPIVAAACLGLVVAVAAWFAASVWEERLARAKFTAIAGDYASVMQNGLDEYLGKIVAVRAFYDSSHAVDPNDSLKYLTQYPVNRLKLAQEFVFRVTIDYRNAAVVRAAIRLANELGIEVIAEGVETEAHVRFLMGADCEQAQCYFFSRPVTVLKATELLRAGRIEPKADPLRRLTSSAA